jgi:hypothetical protein
LRAYLQTQETVGSASPESYATTEYNKPPQLGASHLPRQPSASVSGTRPTITPLTHQGSAHPPQSEPLFSPSGRTIMTNRVPTYYSLKLSRKTAQKHLSPRQLAKNQASQTAAGTTGNAPANEGDKLFAYVVREIINTEQDYLADLKMVVDVSIAMIRSFKFYLKLPKKEIQFFVKFHIQYALPLKCVFNLLT